MFGWRACKELEFMFTLNAIAWGLVVLALTVYGSTLPDWTVVGLGGLALALAGAHLGLGSMVEPERGHYIPGFPPLWARLLSVVLGGGALAALLAGAATLGYPRVGAALAALVTAPLYLGALSLLCRPGRFRLEP